MLSSLVTTQKPWCGLGVWFSLLVYLVRTSCCYPMSSLSDPGINFSQMRKTKTCSLGRDAWICWKALQYCLSFCPSCPVIRIVGLFSSCMKNTKYLLFYLLGKKLRCSHVPGYGFDWLAGIIVNHSLDLGYKFGSSFLIRRMLPSCHTFIITIGLV